MYEESCKSKLKHELAVFFYVKQFIATSGVSIYGGRYFKRFLSIIWKMGL